MGAITQQLMSYGAAPVGSGTTWSPTDKTLHWTTSNGDRRATVNNFTQSIRCTRGSAAAEKLYVELPVIDVGVAGTDDNIFFGLCLSSQAIGSIGSPFWLINGAGTVSQSGGSASGSGAGAIVTTDYVMFAYDHDLKRVWIGKNGAWRNSGAPAAGTGYVYEFTSVASFKIVSQTNGSNGTAVHVVDFNDGATYQGTLPAGFTKW